MRYRSVIDLHTVNRMQAFGWPPIVVAISLLVVLAIGALIGTQGPEAVQGMQEGMRWNGGIFALLGPLLGYGLLAMGQYFPLALGMGLTRREYAGGMSLYFLASAAVYAVVITIGKIIEVATDGFGLKIRFFDVVYTGTGHAWQTLLQTFLLIVAAQFLGATLSTLFLRFGQAFLWIGGGILALLALGIGAAVLRIDGVGRTLLDVLTMGWGPWMVTIAVIGAASAGVWAWLVRRTQVR